MAQIAHEQSPRISQVLPTVTCSTCGLPVPFASLGDHVCAPRPPPNVLSLQKPSQPQKSAPPQRPLSRSDTRTSSSERPSRDGEPVLAPSRDPSQRLSPDTSSAPTNIPLALHRPRPSDARTPPPDRVSAPSRDPLPPALQRIRTPSNARRPSPLSSARPAHPVQPGDSPARRVSGRPAALSPAPRDNVPPPPPPSSFAIHSLSSAIPPFTLHSRPSLERAHTPSSTGSTSHPSLDKPRPPLDKLPPSLDARRPSLEPHHASTEQHQILPPGVPFPRLLVRGISSPSPGPVPFPVLPPPMTTRQPPPPPLSLARDREIDTKIGGEAGMAGVGRRGFAAATRAAMFVPSISPVHQPFGDVHQHNASQYLDRNATFGHVFRAAMTPPSSPNSAQTPSPVSPLPISPVSLGNNTNEQYPRLPSPHDTTSQPASPASNSKVQLLPISPGARIASPPHLPPSIPNPFERRLSGETIAQSPMPGDSLLLPFLDVLKPEFDLGNESDDGSVYTTHTDLKRDGNMPPSPSADSDVGLAYAHDSDDDMPVVMPLDIRKSATSRDHRHPLGPSRQISGASSRSAVSTSSAATSFVSAVRSRSTTATTKSVGALARAMETLIEEGASVSVLASGSVLASIGGSAASRGAGKPSRSNTVPGPASPEQKPPKLPTRSHTSPSNPHIHSERVGVTGEVARVRNRVLTKQKDRRCAGCSSKIEDGRWIQMDGGNVLCERCWKNMYLPKCRRCNLPIEKQAVSSRDGQLKGKYHKDCFNCHACQKPFPDKEFYVFDGKPFCAYHYHEANNSLCGASSCGQPIEGPCAVTHSGKRYHPEHLLCEFEGGCKERLEEYWEVDGQMLCECHATLVGSHSAGWARGHDPVSSTQAAEASARDEGRMKKRMTRFIDLGGGGDDEFDIR